MRIMDGTSKRRDKNENGHYTASEFDPMLGGNNPEEAKANKRKR